jgi:hypothetical protein
VLAAGLAVGALLILDAEDGNASADDLVPFVALEPGQCFDHPSLDPSVSRVEIRSCDSAHDGEVISSRTLAGSFTAEHQIREKALDLCESAVRKRLESIPDDGHEYYNYALYPHLNTYRLQQERRVSCTLTVSEQPGGEKLTEPLPE